MAEPRLDHQGDYAGGTALVYFGEAAPGTATSSAGWRIRKFTYDGTGNYATDKYADGTAAFDKIWDNRGGYSY